MKPKLYTQEKMGEDILSKPKKPPKQYDSWKELFGDPEAPEDVKLKMLGWIVRFETLNGFTKADLQAVIRWMFNENYEWEEVENPPPDLKIVKGTEGKNDG